MKRAVALKNFSVERSQRAPIKIGHSNYQIQLQIQLDYIKSRCLALLSHYALRLIYQLGKEAIKTMFFYSTGAPNTS